MRLVGIASLSDALLVAKGAAAPSRQRQRRSAPSDGRLRVALRIDEPRHRRLRIAAAHFHKSVQGVMLAALDHYLDRIVPSVLEESCECLARRATTDMVVPIPLRSP